MTSALKQRYEHYISFLPTDPSKSNTLHFQEMNVEKLRPYCFSTFLLANEQSGEEGR